MTILHFNHGTLLNRTTGKKFFGQLHGKYLIEAAKFNKRSNPQNSYYWLMLTMYVQPALYEAGWDNIKTKDDAHEFVAEMFLTVKMTNEKTGESKPRVRSTTELTKEEFNIYLEEIWRWAAEYLGITIPSPNEQLDMYE